MIVKSGRLYLWQNNINEKDLHIKIGEGGTSNDYVEIIDTKLKKVIDAEAVEIKYSDKELPVNDNEWRDTLTDVSAIPPKVPITIKDYLNEETRKITIYIKITPTSEAIQLGEIGLFVTGSPDVMISKNFMHRQTISGSEAKIIKYTINI